ncbi:MAG TPA: amidase, partial [bacterium]|nr:amidase [bacterium]
RIHELDGSLHSFITVLPEKARAEARRAEGEIRQGQYRGPLHGVPLAIKDIFATSGIRTTAGSRVLRNWMPTVDATLVGQLREAGAVLLGKLNMSEFAYGTVHPDYGPPRNPWNPERFTGGSSSGSGAAVASSLCAGSFGTDTGGSIRGPAAHCGIVGFKPTYGAVGLGGVIPLSQTLDHVGPMARTVEDTAILFGAVAAGPWAVPSPVEEIRPGIAGMRLGVAAAHLDGEVQREIRTAVRQAITALGGKAQGVVDVALPDDDQVVAAWFSICMVEASRYHAGTLATRLQDYGEPLQARLLAGLGIPGPQYVQARRARHRIIERFAGLFRTVDLVALPTMSAEAPTLEAAMTGSWAGLRARIRSLAPFNLAGLPAITVPCGRTASGLPIGLQLVGARGADWTVLRAAYTYERLSGWDHVPQVL